MSLANFIILFRSLQLLLIRQALWSWRIVEIKFPSIKKVTFLVIKLKNILLFSTTVIFQYLIIKRRRLNFPLFGLLPRSPFRTLPKKLLLTPSNYYGPLATRVILSLLFHSPLNNHRPSRELPKTPPLFLPRDENFHRCTEVR